MRWLRMIVMACMLPLAWPAAASDLTVKVIGGDGKPVSDAVLTVTRDALAPDSAKPSSIERPAAAIRIIDQKNASPDPITMALSLIPDPRLQIDREHLRY